MGSEHPEDLGPAAIPAEEEPQEIGGLINSDGEEVDFSDLSEFVLSLCTLMRLMYEKYLLI